MYPRPIQNLIDCFAKLPSVGHKTAERLVFYLLKSHPDNITALSQALTDLRGNIVQCRHCRNFSIGDPCEICADLRRDRTKICVVAKPQELAILEKTGAYRGLYFVLNASINPLQGDGDWNRPVAELISYVRQVAPAEIILALSPDMSGETATMYLTKILRQFPDLKITRLARGLPMGAELEYADELTLENALAGRQDIK